jgi:hypothetical protein
MLHGVLSNKNIKIPLTKFRGPRLPLALCAFWADKEEFSKVDLGFRNFAYAFLGKPSRKPPENSFVFYQWGGHPPPPPPL